MIVVFDWTEFEAKVNTLNASIQFSENSKSYALWVTENGTTYKCKVIKDGGSNVVDFETNYKANGNNPIHPMDADGKPYNRAESRPLNKTTYFTMVGDDATTLRAGQKTIYDFANTDNDVVSPPTGFKQKQLDLTFLNALNLKEGTIYFKNMEWGSYIDLSVVAPAPLVHPTVDVTVEHFVANHFMFGTNNLGDELNTEAASGEIPVGFIFRLLITVPDTTWTAGLEPAGFVSFEMYTGSTISVV